MASEGNSETTDLDGDRPTNCTSFERETLSADDETKNDLNGIQHRNLILEAKETGNDVIEDEGHERNSDTKNNENDCGIGIKSKFDRDVYDLQCNTAKPTEEQIKSKPPAKDIIDVECGEISTTVKSECNDFSNSESKRHK